MEWSPCRRVGRAEEVKVGEKSGGRNRGIVKTESQMRLGGMPVTKKVGGQAGDAALISRDGSVGEECFLQGEEGGGSVHHETGF